MKLKKNPTYFPVIFVLSLKPATKILNISTLELRPRRRKHEHITIFNESNHEIARFLQFPVLHIKRFPRITVIANAAIWPKDKVRSNCAGVAVSMLVK